MKLKAFIGSSYENLNVARAIKRAIEKEVECTVWVDENFFRLSKTALDTLAEKVGEFDAGIFVFGEDDTVTSRGTDYSATRDNVIFEHGLFCGRLGPERTFVIRAKSVKLKWLSDLKGFSPAEYDQDVAKADVDGALERPCKQVINELRQLTRRPGIYIAQEPKRHFGQDWWTYSGSDVSSTFANKEGVEIQADGDIGLRFPRIDNLAAKGRYCVVRLKPMSDSPKDHRFYFLLKGRNDDFFLSLADSHSREGWGYPENEFMLCLPHLRTGKYATIAVDLKALEPFVGSDLVVGGFRLRKGIRVSHICVCDELPTWLRDATVLTSSTAPSITIDSPIQGAEVGLRHPVKGSVKIPSKPSAGSNDLQIFVYSPDGFWYPQGYLKITGEQWTVDAGFGNEKHGAHSEFQVVAQTTEGKPANDRVKILPPALARAKVRVNRK
jgi:Predicted nucleotide-binding protein containing TIR-like domain